MRQADGQVTSPVVSVGIFTRPEATFTLTGIYQSPDGAIATGRGTARAEGGKVVWDSREWDELTFAPTSLEGDSFELEGVTIGVDFHWERTENQRFRGALKLIARGGNLTAINLIPVEEYLKSVISSEMKASASPALLRAHAVISRSWLLAQMAHDSENKTPEVSVDEGETIRWWDHEEHTLFDVCADDHCQRYQGLARMEEQAVSAVEDTRGVILTSEGGRICDARFSKCCGGVFERFSTCWADEDSRHPYLAPRRDWTDPADFPDLTREENARRWIESSPEAFCNTVSRRVLAQVLNDYDREQTDFYRWEVTYTRGELSDIIRRRLGRDLGDILSLEPLARGTSGRISRLRITGTKGSEVIGKELMIRRTLSETHLRSSAFTVSVEGDTFRLRGAGWGHGVGLCQIGAAMMGEAGYAWQEILRRYYPGANLTTLY